MFLKPSHRWFVGELQYITHRIRCSYTMNLNLIQFWQIQRSKPWVRPAKVHSGLWTSGSFSSTSLANSTRNLNIQRSSTKLVSIDFLHVSWKALSLFIALLSVDQYCFRWRRMPKFRSSLAREMPMRFSSDENRRVWICTVDAMTSTCATIV